MARFRGTVKGSRSEVSRSGTPNSGIVGNLDGWDVGIRVIGRDDKGVDVFDIYRTGGSSGGVETHIGTVRSDLEEIDIKVP
ncbi:hypothetical protein LCGC14_1330260 [marine sediment metagenome]|uniref:Uncharacterized protein n=1 Tax=marine sediment metagenome TaxID=412755 RepID=A0A0F9MXP7_9ZZZZ